MKKITGVKRGSPAWRAGIRPGAALLSVNGHAIKDVLDYSFYTAAETLQIELSVPNGGKRSFTVRKEEYEDAGMNFETYLMDAQRPCRNNCRFCFVDQLPKGMRESLYFKDDDERLSMLYGNYITLTNLSREQIDRIMALHISPINISVHATDPDVRKALLNNRFAGELMTHMRRFAKAGINMNAQLVICPGINDGIVLDKSLTELIALQPQLHSISVIPAGLTCHREGLTSLVPVDAAKAQELINVCDAFGARCIEQFGTRIVYASDELYVRAGKDVPQYDYYEDFPQLDNGVGMMALLERQFMQALERVSPQRKGYELSVATGCAAAAFIQKLIDEFAKKCDNKVSCHLYPIKNQLFGETVDVAGLVTGKDIAAALSGQALGKRLLIPASMLRSGENVFLDDMTTKQLSDKLKVRIAPVGVTGAEFVAALLCKKPDKREFAQ